VANADYLSNILYLTREPQQPPEDLRQEIDALREQTSDLKSRPPSGSKTQDHNQLLILARETVSDGETIYAQSVAANSVFGEDVETTSEQRVSLFAWLHRQVFEATQRSLPAITGDEDDIPEERHTTTDVNQASWEQDDPYEDESDDELDFERNMVDTLYDSACAAFDRKQYHDAKSRLTTVTAMIRDQVHSAFNLFELEYRLSVATFYSAEHRIGQSVLLQFVRQEATTDEQRFYIAEASQLLAETYITLGNLAAAKLSCTNALRILGCLYDRPARARMSKTRCLALLARIEILLGRPHWADAIMYNIDSENAKFYLGQYSSVTISKSLSAKQRNALSIKESSIFQGFSVDAYTGALKPTDGQAAEECRSATSMTPLHFAAIFRDTEYASALLEDGADPNAKATLTSQYAGGWRTENGLTPLICAIFARHENMILLLASKGASLSLKRSTADLSHALLCDVPYEFENPSTVGGIVRCLQHFGWDIDTILDDSGQTLLHKVATAQNVELAEIFMSLGSSVTFRDVNGRLPIQISVCQARLTERCLEMLDLFLRQDTISQLNYGDRDGRTAQHCVFCNNDAGKASKLARYLISRGCNVLAEDHRGDRPLDLALRCEAYTHDIAVLLETRAAEQLSRRANGRPTPLQIALTNKNVAEATIETLLKAGADPLDVDHANVTMAVRIRERNHWKALWPLLPIETEGQDSSEVETNVSRAQ
jgi:ankyrin repeat protein